MKLFINARFIKDDNIPDFLMRSGFTYVPSKVGWERELENQDGVRMVRALEKKGFTVEVH